MGIFHGIVNMAYIWIISITSSRRVHAATSLINDGRMVRHGGEVLVWLGTLQ
jgi:hypothetical protein